MAPSTSKTSKTSKSSKPKASEVAAETKKYFIPLVRKKYASTWPTMSYLYHQPLRQLSIPRCLSNFPSPPTFHVTCGDPVDFAMRMAASETDRTGEEVRVPFICAANEKRPGGDWETGVAGYEERLCRRSTLSAALSTPAPGSTADSNYPIPCEGGILSTHVVVFRGLHDRYERLGEEEWDAVPVVSVVPARWPKLSHSGTKYSFDTERDLVKVKLRAALRICLYNGYRYVVVGDWGLGNGCRNPPQEMAELWREVFLYDPDLRGQFIFAAFVFEDERQSTTRLILEDIAKKGKGGSSSSKSKGKGSSSSSGGSSSSSGGGGVTDFDVFRGVFDEEEIQKVLSQPDPRFGLEMITS
ncbi:uncharacterized protein DNG_10295 [Cephalotrichum gorgonifer]|uniref:Microbial-type PARG catalytic domain-containing protein n=1 Tax=Cephalotrichum gorgonifer TaxID=2041049 RepID=A0AAE8N9D9_9PEZI|nr:uncharacterized protein DNG_10295 [Cephalotrichum gorgonifer]